MIAKDDPEHIEQRKLVSDRFTPKGVREYVPRLESLIAELIDGMVADVARDGSTEVVDGLAAQLPSRLTTDLLGFPEDKWRDVKSWSERLMRIDSDVLRYLSVLADEDVKDVETRVVEAAKQAEEQARRRAEREAERAAREEREKERERGALADDDDDDEPRYRADDEDEE